MAPVPNGGLARGGWFRLRSLLSEWWQHRASFLISLVITLAALGIYFFTFLGDRSTPLFDFLKRFEYSTLDTRFRYRPAKDSVPDSRIVIVAIDQRSQEVLGKWPFSRKYFGQMLDALRQDGAKVASFDITFDNDMTRIVFATNGTLDKYIGDAVMAFWGAPYEDARHPVQACTAALEMMQRVGELQKKWAAEGKPALDIGIGLNSGAASLGNMGSSLRYGYTALGDTVNLSSRLEGLNKEYGTHIIANESTYEAAKVAGFLFRELDLIRVKGKLQPVTIYELFARLSDLEEAALTDARARLSKFADARALYKERKWAAALEAFQKILDRWPKDGPSLVYLKRCEEYLAAEPVSDWDGVFVMTHK